MFKITIANEDVMNLGLFGWDDIEGNDSNGSSDKKRLGYTKFEAGKDTVIRVLDESPFSAWRHWIANANNGEGKKRGRSIVCAGGDCPICKVIKTAKETKTPTPYSSSKKHTIHVLNKTTGEVELLEQGKTFFMQLLGYQKAMGDLRGIDIKVIRTGSTKDNTTYTMIPIPGQPLTDDEKALYEANKIDLKEHLRTFSPEQVQMFMEGKDPKEIYDLDDKESVQEEDEDIVVED